jgi:hypothetical protein
MSIKCDHKNQIFKRKRAKGQESKGLLSPRGDTHNTKTDIVVTVVAGIVVAIRRTAVVRIVVPRTAALDCLSHL